MAELSMDQLHQEYTDEAAAKEASAYPTLPRGSYNVKFDKVTPKEGDDPEREDQFGRRYATLSGTITDGKVTVRVNVDASWQVYRVNPATKKSERITEENKNVALAESWLQDKSSKLWGQLVTVFEAGKKPVPEILELAKMYPVSVFVTENYQTPEGWRGPRTEEEAKTYREKGYTRKNFVQSISKAR